jgi:hypothetical protein
VIPRRRGDRHKVALLFDKLTAGAVRRGPELLGESSGMYGVDVDYTHQVDACVALIAEGMCAGDRATPDNPDAELCFVGRHVHLANPNIVALCSARIARRITSKVCFWEHAVSVRLITSCTKSG